MFFNIFCSFFDFSDSKMSYVQIYAILSVKSTSGKVFDNYEL